MPKYQRKPEIIEATQWFKMGDHPDVTELTRSNEICFCDACGKTNREHGKLNPGFRRVCPGDWIVTNSKGVSVMSDKEFRDKFEPVPFDIGAMKVDEKLSDYKTPIYGQCARCGGNLTADHKCPEWAVE